MSIRLQDVHSQLAWLCDAMIPGDGTLGHPSAREVGLPARLLPMALATRADLAPAFLAIIARLPAQRPEDPLACVHALVPDERALLGRFIAGAYLADETVMRRVGYPGFQALTTDTDFDEIMAAVEPVIARGACYRKA